MERLTKNDYGEYWLEARKEPRAIKKLGILEDIEQELGITLEVLFKALKEGIWAKHLYTNGKKITYHKPCQLHFYRDVFVLWVSDEYDNEFIRVVKEYGKTWALTREELE